MTGAAIWLVSGASAGALPQIPALPVIGETVIIHDQAGIALLGYDPVAYFAEGRAVGGSPAHELHHQGLVWRFVSGANLAAFAADPDAYKPAFGGHDAAAMAGGRAVDSEPRWFAISGQSLYLFRTRENRDRFAGDAELRRGAHAAWPALERQLSR